MEDLKKKADYIRDEILRVAIPHNAGHIAPSLSCVDILVALYYRIMDKGDRLIFSKAHGAYGLYAILADKGLLPKEEWDNFYIEGKSSLSGCAERNAGFGIEAGCGSLGHGLPLATGLAFGLKDRVFCVVGDGELEEGTAWEALQFAKRHKLGNLFVIVDNNGLSAMDFLSNIMDEDIPKRFEGFGFSPVFCEGNDAEKVSECIESAKDSDIPKIIIAKTTKGFGLKCMENQPKFHFRVPAKEDLEMGKTYGKLQEGDI